MDLALFSQGLSFTLLLLVTLLGYYHGSNWDTISDMITRNGRLRNCFALFVGIIIVAQLYYCIEMLRRFRQQNAKLHVLKLLVWVAMATSVGGAIGFAIVSTDIGADQHLFFAAIAFTSIYVYIVTFYYVAHNHHVYFMSGATASIVAMTASGFLLALQLRWGHYAEYMFVASMHSAAACLCVQRRVPSLHDQQILVLTTDAGPASVTLTSSDHIVHNLKWVYPAPVWSVQEPSGQFRVALSCVRSVEHNPYNRTLYVKGTGNTIYGQFQPNDIHVVQTFCNGHKVPFK